MKVIINQFAGLGDVLFIEPIYRHFHNLGYEVIAPVNSDILWIQEYIPYVEFKNKEGFKYDYESPTQKNDGNLHIPMRFAHPLLRGYDLHYGDDRANWMPDKYTFNNLPVELWKTLSFARNEKRENEVFQAMVKGFGYERYNFINNSFGGSFEQVNIKVDNGLPNVYLEKLQGYTLLDWGKVIEGAENIHTVETSVIYYIESLKTIAKEFHLYPRFPWLEHVDYMRGLLGEKWIYHTKDDL